MLHPDALLEPRYLLFQLLLVLAADDSKLNALLETAVIGRKVVQPSHAPPQGQPIFNKCMWGHKNLAPHLCYGKLWRQSTLENLFQSWPTFCYISFIVQPLPLPNSSLIGIISSILEPPPWKSWVQKYFLNDLWWIIVTYIESAYFYSLHLIER